MSNTSISAQAQVFNGLNVLFVDSPLLPSSPDDMHTVIGAICTEKAIDPAAHLIVVADNSGTFTLFDYATKTYTPTDKTNGYHVVNSFKKHHADKVAPFINNIDNQPSGV